MLKYGKNIWSNARFQDVLTQHGLRKSGQTMFHSSFKGSPASCPLQGLPSIKQSLKSVPKSVRRTSHHQLETRVLTQDPIGVFHCQIIKPQAKQCELSPVYADLHGRPSTPPPSTQRQLFLNW